MKRAGTRIYLGVGQLGLSKIESVLSELFPNKPASYKTQNSVDKKYY